MAFLLRKTIFIQQDNARPLTDNKNSDFKVAANKDGFNITLVQPLNSSYVNVNDLMFFAATQSLQHEQAWTNADDLIATVIYNFNKLEPMTLNKVDLLL